MAVMRAKVRSISKIHGLNNIIWSEIYMVILDLMLRRRGMLKHSLKSELSMDTPS